MIKIAFIIDSIYTPAAGTESQLLCLIRNLDRTRFAPTLCILRTSDWVDNNFDLCPIYHVGIDSFKNPRFIFRLARFANFLSHEGFSIVQTHFNDANKAGILAARLAGVPAIISTRRNQGYWHNRKELFFLKFLNMGVDLFLANSYSTKKWAIETEGLAPHKVDVIYNALDLHKFQHLSPDIGKEYRSLLGIPANAFVVGIIANLRQVKRIDIFIRAARLVKEQLPKAKFLVVGEAEGDSKYGKEQKALAVEEGLDGELFFLGRRSDVVNLLKTMDVAVLTSESESFSNSVVEYLAAGLPVVSTDVGGAREAIVNGKNGYIVPVNDYGAISEKIVAVAQDHSMRSLDEWNLQRIEELFSLSTIIKQYEALYSSLVSRKGHPSADTDVNTTFYQKLNSYRYSDTIRRIGKSAFCSIVGRSFVVRTLNRYLSSRVVILTYHMIDDKEDINGLSINRAFFEQQLAYLTKMYKVISLEDAVSRLVNGNLEETFIVVTFDDGYFDTYHTAYPLLKQYNVPATVFISCEAVETGYYDWIFLDEVIMRMTGSELDLSTYGLGRFPVKSGADKRKTIIDLHSSLKKINHLTRRKIIDNLAGGIGQAPERVMMNWKEVIALAQSGLVTIGAHTVSHPILSQLSPEEASCEIAGSKRIIEEKIGMTVDLFAYPNGGRTDFTNENVEMVKSSGFSAACTTISDTNRQGDDPYSLKRIDVTYGICKGVSGRFSRSMFAAYISGAMNLLIRKES